MVALVFSIILAMTSNSFQAGTMMTKGVSARSCSDSSRSRGCLRWMVSFRRRVQSQK